MLDVLKGSILVRAILCVVHTFGNAYRCSLLEKFVSAVYRSWRGSFIHHICSKYVNKKPFYQSSLIYRFVMAIGRILDKPFGAIYRAFKPAVDNSKISNFAKVAVGKDCRSRAYGAGLLLMAIPIGSLIALIMKGNCTPITIGMCVAVFIFGLALSFGVVFNEVIQNSLVVKFVKWVISSLE